MEDIRKVRKITGKAGCEIYEVEIGPQKYRACSKIITYKSESQLTKLINEIIILSSVKNLKMGLKYIRFQIETQPNGAKALNILTEFCTGGNLDHFIQKKKKDNNPYTYRQLKNNFFDLIEFFKILQDQKISHRDIKPENFFLTKDDQIKVGDFGSSKEIAEDLSNTITGSPYYLSPELREGYTKFQARNGGRYIEYSPHKSDVYSLGLVFLHMITLEKLYLDSDSLEELENETKRRVEGLRHKTFRVLLGQMLIFNPEKRPDFVGVFELVQRLFSPNLCFECGEKPLDRFKVVCQDCDAVFHFNCLNSTQCLNCASVIKNSCARCNEIEFWKCITHKFCKVCAMKNQSCTECRGFDIYEPIQDNFDFFVPNFECFTCNSTLISKNHLKEVVCENCKEVWCKVCKRKSHSYSCSETQGMIRLKCACGRVHAFNFEGIFFECEEKTLCLVCMKDVSQGHLRCSVVINQLI